MKKYDYNGSAIGGSENDVPDVAKDDQPHAEGSPEDSAHDVVEEGSSFKGELEQLSPEGKKNMLAHLRAMKKDPKNWKRSEENRAKGKDMKKYDLVKSLSDAGHRESALLLKNWGEMDAVAEQMLKSLEEGDSNG